MDPDTSGGEGFSPVEDEGERAARVFRSKPCGCAASARERAKKRGGYTTMGWRAMFKN